MMDQTLLIMKMWARCSTEGRNWRNGNRHVKRWEIESDPEFGGTQMWGVLLVTSRRPQCRGQLICSCLALKWGPLLTCLRRPDLGSRPTARDDITVVRLLWSLKSLGSFFRQKAPTAAESSALLSAFNSNQYLPSEIWQKGLPLCSGLFLCNC